jgi:hypothetical protein
MCQCGGPQCGEPIAARGLDCKRCGGLGSQSRTLIEVPAFVSRQPPRSAGESLVQRIFSRDSGFQKAQA